jgi:hypothetical protein
MAASAGWLLCGQPMVMHVQQVAAPGWQLKRPGYPPLCLCHSDSCHAGTFTAGAADAAQPLCKPNLILSTPFEHTTQHKGQTPAYLPAHHSSGGYAHQGLSEDLIQDWGELLTPWGCP